MKPFQDEQKLDDTNPSSWVLSPSHQIECLNLIELYQDNFHLCEIRIDRDTDRAVTIIRKVTTKSTNLRPAIPFAFFVKLKTGLLLRCIHLSLNTSVKNHYQLCTKLFSKAKNIYVHLEHDRLGNTSVPVNFYGCHFKDVWVSCNGENHGETKLCLSSRLASLGYTMSFYTPQALIRKSIMQ